MARKSELAGRHLGGHAPVTAARLLTFLAVGFALGGLGGWIFMGTMHAVGGRLVGAAPAGLRV